MTARKKALKGAEKGPRARGGRSRQRQRLIDACISALHIYGPSRTTVARVVAIAKMSPGIVRFYFDSKAAMLIASLQFLSAEFERRVLHPVTILKGSPVAALELMVDLYLDPDIASPRKVSVWYAFWGEASSRQEYYDICGQKDESFAVLVRELMERLIVRTSGPHLDSDGIALGFIGALEILWQDIAFQTERDIDRPAAKRRCMAYLRSIFPEHFAPVDEASTAMSQSHRGAHLPGWCYGDAEMWAIEREILFQSAWTIVGHQSQLLKGGDFIAADVGVERALLVRDESGAVHALRNNCPAVPHALVAGREGRFDSLIECSMHGLRFSLDGRACGDRMAGNLQTLDFMRSAEFLWARPSGAARQKNLEGARAVVLEIELASGLMMLGSPAETWVDANWKVVVEQWLESASTFVTLSSGFPAIAWQAPLKFPVEWSARHYIEFMACLPEHPWQRQFIAPHQLVEARPDGVSVLQVMPTAPGRSLLRRLDYTALPPDDSARAALYLAQRVDRFTRRTTLDVAESAQRGMIDFGYGAGRKAPAADAIAWFHTLLSSLLPVLPHERPANASRISL